MTRSLHRDSQFGEEDSAKQIPVLRLDGCSLRQACSQPTANGDPPFYAAATISNIAPIGNVYDEGKQSHDRASAERCFGGRWGPIGGTRRLSVRKAAQREAIKIHTPEDHTLPLTCLFRTELQ